MYRYEWISNIRQLCCRDTATLFMRKVRGVERERGGGEGGGGNIMREVYNISAIYNKFKLPIVAVQQNCKLHKMIISVSLATVVAALLRSTVISVCVCVCVCNGIISLNNRMRINLNPSIRLHDEAVHLSWTAGQPRETLAILSLSHLNPLQLVDQSLMLSGWE